MRPTSRRCRRRPVQGSTPILLVGLLACGGGDVQGPEEDPENPVLDFSGVVGTWSGWDITSDGETWVRITITGNAEKGEVVGTQVVGGVSGTVLQEECVGDVIGMTADHPTYTASFIGSCTYDGSLQLEYQSNGPVLRQVFDAYSGGFHGEVNMTPGSDPGDPPAPPSGR